ncbi:MAG: phage tail protein [Bacteroidota bacterium]|nr:phage tail protein [Bacteroidota bacterium]MDO9614290.1 phage tail protein [Bacteroidota bacterium]
MANYPLPKFHFLVEWGGTRIGFTEVTGLTIENEVIEYREGSSPEYNKTKMPGLRKFGNITLKRGTFANDNEFFNWLNTVKLNTIERRDLIINLLNENHEPVVVYNVKQAWPVKIQAPDMKSDANEAAIESLEIAHEGLVIQNG